MKTVPIAVTVQPKKDPIKTMKALTWQGPTSMKLSTVPRPMITDPGDALIKITTTTICGSDLHLYHKELNAMVPGDILGHEFMGIVEDIGPDIKSLQKGDRVVVGFPIADGTCFYCKKGQFSLCDNTNPSKMMEDSYGSRLSGMFGYSHLTGGYPGGQAEYVRVPLADVNCLKVPPTLEDEQVLFLSDIVCTGWHGNELAEVGPGDVVAVWGCGPVGLMALALAKLRGASRIIGIDCIPNRLQVVTEKLGGEVINFGEKDPVQELKTMVPDGPDCVIDCAGFRFPKSFAHKLQRAIHLETDSPEVLKECIKAVRKGGHVAIIGDYFFDANGFPIGPMMEKSLTVRGGQAFVQKYWKDLLGKIERGEFDPRFVITHRLPLEQGVQAYAMFDKKEDNAIKIILKPKHTEE